MRRSRTGAAGHRPGVAVPPPAAPPINQVIHGDCVAGLQQLPAESVDLAFADPPFNIGYDYDVYKDNLDRHQYLQWSAAWIMQVYRVLKPNGTFWLMIGDEYAAQLSMLAGKDPLLNPNIYAEATCPRGREWDAVREGFQGFHLRSWVVWYYTFGVNCENKFTRSHAHLFYFTKHREKFTFHETQVRVPSARQLVYKDKRANPDGRLPDDTWVLRPEKLHEGFPANGDMWCISRIAGTFGQRESDAANQTPEQMLGRIIRGCSNPGDLVIDPFAGTATTAVVAKKLGRRYLSWELSPGYAVRCQERLNRTKEGDPLQGPVPIGG